MLNYKSELEKLNYYSWARFLEQINDDNALVRVIDKLELATPQRTDLSVYREILRKLENWDEYVKRLDFSVPDGIKNLFLFDNSSDDSFKNSIGKAVEYFKNLK